MTFNKLLILCALSIIATTLLLSFANRFCVPLRLMDVPGERKLHEKSTPLVGGIVLILVVLPAVFAVVLSQQSDLLRETMLLYIGSVGGIVTVGLADDRHDLSARNRIIFGFSIFAIAAFISPLFNVRVLDFDWPVFSIGLGNLLFSIAFTTLCLVGLINAVNMADGKNGLVIGLCLGWLALLATRCPEPFIPLIWILSSALIVMLIFNIANKVFLGDGGAYGLAASIGLLAIVTYNTSGNHAGRAISANELMLLFAVPVLDSFRLTFNRLRQGRSPMSADRDHLHHHLLHWFGWPGGLIIYWVIALAPAALWFAYGK